MRLLTPDGGVTTRLLTPDGGDDTAAHPRRGPVTIRPVSDPRVGAVVIPARRRPSGANFARRAATTPPAVIE